jgi:hypothetical protein
MEDEDGVLDLQNWSECVLCGEPVDNSWKRCPTCGKKNPSAAAEEQRKIEAAKRNGKIEVRYNHYKVPLLPALPFLTFSTFFVVATAVVKGNRKEEFHHQCCL